MKAGVGAVACTGLWTTAAGVSYRVNSTSLGKLECITNSGAMRGWVHLSLTEIFQLGHQCSLG